MDRRTRDILVSSGSALYWACSPMAFFGLTEFGHFLQYSLQWYTNTMCFVAMFLVALLFTHRCTRRSLNALSMTAALLSLGSGILLIACFYLEDPFRTPLVYCYKGLHGVGMGILMQLWGLHFSVTGVRDSINVVCATLFLSMSLFFVTVALPVMLRGSLYFLFPLFSALFSLALRDTGQTDILSSDTSRKRQRVGFWGSRVLYGICIGLILGLVAAIPLTADIGPIALNLSGFVGIVLVALLLFLEITKKTIRMEAFWLPSIPFIAVALFSVFLIDSSMEILIPIAVSTCFLCFMVLSSVQISNYRVLFGTSATQIAFGEKVAVYMPWTLSLLVGTAVGSWFGLGKTVIDIAVGIFTLLLTIATIFALSRYSATLNAMDYFKESPPDLRSLIISRAHTLAEKHGLTPREREMLVFMAMGRSGTYIIKELVISEGTYNTHCHHIYQKLDIHRNQELLDLIHAKDGDRQ